MKIEGYRLLFLSCFVAYTRQVTVIYFGNRLPVSEDMNSATCIDVNRGFFQAGTHYLELGFEYNQDTVLKVTGRRMACGVFGAQCDAFSTAVVAQGRDPAICVGAPLCGKADKCPLVDMVTNDTGMQECSYRCPCNGQGNANCQKVVMYFGNGSVAIGHNVMSICDVMVTV